MKKFFLFAVMIFVASANFAQLRAKEELVRVCNMVIRHEAFRHEKIEKNEFLAGKFYFPKTAEWLSLDVYLEKKQIVIFSGILRRDSVNLEFRLKDSSLVGIAYSHKPISGWEKIASKEALCSLPAVHFDPGVSDYVWVNYQPKEMLAAAFLNLQKIDFEVIYGYTHVVQ